VPGTLTESKAGGSHYFNEISPALLYHPRFSQTVHPTSISLYQITADGIGFPEKSSPSGVTW
jgi:hypothetical protein